ncbi:MmoB/DmpM family protein [[Mycobacterium] crassicus]|uniref:MmoB/DmpM family protein n=1 Tax=[Mycobacterium] crassicus TaxID=2872309 RepID=A0ABU5XJD5_9MYCO|nr:MmoB/DmpM family protein [Mycolicibacter sp. MYC098]MEB3022124.1 MmoB/DmpM family protein [Mycolicibacter sp. MYC098]
MTEPRTQRIRNVSLDLQDNDASRPIIDAIERDNPNVELKRMPGMVKLTSPGHLVIRRLTVEEMSGQEWDTEELQLVIISLSGNIDTDEDQILIKWDR